MPAAFVIAVNKFDMRVRSSACFANSHLYNIYDAHGCCVDCWNYYRGTFRKIKPPPTANVVIEQLTSQCNQLVDQVARAQDELASMRLTCEASRQEAAELRSRVASTLLSNSRLVNTLNTAKHSLSISRDQLQQLRQQRVYWSHRSLELSALLAKGREKQFAEGRTLSFDDDEASRLEAFFKCAYEMVDKEYATDPYLRDLYKEMFHVEFSSMGKRNKSGSKQGIKNVKVPALVLSHALRLSSRLGKAEYDYQRKLNVALPTWECLRTYTNRVTDKTGVQYDSLEMARSSAALPSFPDHANNTMLLVIDEMTTNSGIVYSVAKKKVYGLSESKAHPFIEDIYLNYYNVDKQTDDAVTGNTVVSLTSFKAIMLSVDKRGYDNIASKMKPFKADALVQIRMTALAAPTFDYCVWQSVRGQMSATDVYKAIREAIAAAHEYGFRIVGVLADGAQCNRQHQRRYFTHSAKELQMPILGTGCGYDESTWMPHPCFPLNIQPVFYISDPSHAIKKLCSRTSTRTITCVLQGREYDLQLRVMMSLWLSFQEDPECPNYFSSFTSTDFIKTSFQEMRVGPCMKVFGPKMIAMITEAQRRREIYLALVLSVSAHMLHFMI